jgi:hypothetical protein
MPIRIDLNCANCCSARSDERAQRFIITNGKLTLSEDGIDE